MFRSALRFGCLSIVLFSDSATRAATNTEQWYVTISRGRKSIRIFTTDKAQLSANKRSDGNGLRRRERKIEEHSPIGQIAITDLSSGLAAYGEMFAGLRVSVFTQRDELLLLHCARQSKQRSVDTEPFATDTLALGVVITDAQVLLKVAPSVCQIGLCFRR